MVTGENVKRARGRLQLTQQQLADQVGVSRRTIAEWENNAELPATAEGRLSKVLTFDGTSRNDDSPPLAAVSDMELVAEMARRLAYLRAQQTGNPRESEVSSDDAGDSDDDGWVGTTGGADTDSRARDPGRASEGT
jgi:transcriptional regulator with XRE-family HTH domain